MTGLLSAQEVDLSVQKTPSVDSIQVGDNVTYTITVTNLGTNDATSVTLQDVLPAEMDFVSLTTTLTCTNIGGIVTCDFGTLSANGTASVDIVTTGNQAGSISNTATVASLETDVNPTNNTATALVTVNSGGSTNGTVDLAGTWTGVDSSCKKTKCKVRGTVEVTNNAPGDAPSSVIKFYLSTDNVFDEGDVLLKRVSTGKIKDGQPKNKKLSAKLPGDPTGMFLLAVLDADGTVSESDETNNTVVFGPL
jgi:uncharacterized repeat protein (TIGR01451 family)